MATSLIAFGDDQIRQFDGLYSLNDLHRLSGGLAKHKPYEYLRLTQTQELVGELVKAGITAFKTTRGRNASTYACKELAIAYAAWISAAFHLRVIRVFLAATAPTPAQPVFDLDSAIDPGKLLLSGNSDPRFALTARQQLLIDRKAWLLAREAYDLARDHLARVVAYRTTVHTLASEQSETIIGDLFKHTNLGNALAHRYYTELRLLMATEAMMQDYASELRSQVQQELDRMSR